MEMKLLWHPHLAPGWEERRGELWAAALALDLHDPLPARRLGRKWEGFQLGAAWLQAVAGNSLFVQASAPSSEQSQGGSEELWGSKWGFALCIWERETWAG